MDGVSEFELLFQAAVILLKFTALNALADGGLGSVAVDMIVADTEDAIFW